MTWFDRYEPWAKQADDSRDPFDIDYGRVVHSASFRRLQGKTQILNLGDSDFYRTRLTHSLEVAQIAGGIANQLNHTHSSHLAHPHLPPRNLIQTSGFCHDLGHPPFGHGGEAALNYCMRKHGGFEGNGQTLRILSYLEKFSKSAGANLSRRTLLAILKYPAVFENVRNPNIIPTVISGTNGNTLDRKSCKPPKCYFASETKIVEWILQSLDDNDRKLFQEVTPNQNKHYKPQHKSFDCSIMDVADDIAYGVHDLEDALALKLIDEKDFREHVSEEACAPFLNSLKDRYPNETQNNVYEHFVTELFADSNKRKRIISRLVHYFIVNVDIETLDQFMEPLLKYRATLKIGPRTFLDTLQYLIEQAVIFSPNVQQLEFKGQHMVVSVFEAMQADPKSLLPADMYALLKASDGDLRVISDYVAGMTDHYLLKSYERLFSPRMGSVFDKL